ncbi:MAG: hypothetical protein LIP16_08630, partial [Clostridium sp.]|nr:hypothetical protein [Clostridium sp.]
QPGMQEQRQPVMQGQRQPGMQEQSQPVMQGHPQPGTQRTPQPVPPSGAPKAFNSLKSADYQGTAALIIGVIFVILAGVIFATTTWHLLSSLLKTVLVLAFTLFLFGASFIAGRGLKIKRTSQAFYILGSVFLFLTVLAAGYFELLGPEFILKSENRWRVLWAGSLVTELALFAGLKQFEDRIYSHACLWGMTVSMTFLMGALRLGYSGFVNGMMYYAFLLVLGLYFLEREPEKAGRTFIGLRMDGVFCTFAVIHFWLFSFLMAGQWMMGCLEAVSRGTFFGQFAATIWSVAAMGTMTLGVAILALKRPDRVMRMLFAGACVLFFQYWVYVIPMDYAYQILAAAMVTGVWFFGAEKPANPLGSVEGDCIYTAFLLINTLALCVISAFTYHGMGEHIAASAAVLLLTAVTARWSRRVLLIRRILPVVPSFLIYTAERILSTGYGVDLEPEMFQFLFFLIVAAWDVLKKDKFCPFLLIAGSLVQFVHLGDVNYPFLVLLSVYLLIRAGSVSGEIQEWYRKGSCAYLLAGICLWNLPDGNQILKMLIVTAVYWAEFGLVCYRRRERQGDLFWDITGTAVFLTTMAGYYFNRSGKLWELGLCMVSFAGFYLFLYRRGKLWPHLLAALAVLPVPFEFINCYGLSEGLAYSIIAAAVVITGGWMRRYRPVFAEAPSLPGGWQADWYHILIGLPLALMLGEMEGGWRTAYLLLLALYVLQYMTVPQLKRPAVTLAAAIGVAAFWTQPFILWPEIVSLEIRLVPAAGFIWLLSPVWGEREPVKDLQTALYCFCLCAMTMDAFVTGKVADGLILEMVCLSIFIWAHIGKYTRWVRISGILIVTAALYMTKNFWLSLSWWVYLLAAGLGLILFAAFNEMKKH